MANEKTPVVWDDDTKKHRPLGTGEKMGGLDASSLLSSDSGNLITSGSDGLAYLSGSGMVDPRADNLLEDSANGKLQVTLDRIAEWLDGHPQDAAALAGPLSETLAAALADGKTIVASGGKLTSDPTGATAAQKAAINSALLDAESGLVVDPETGMAQVDFSQMPTDKFEKLLRGMRMQVPLNEDLSLYVSVNSANAVEPYVVDGKTVYPDGCGTQEKPFRKIQDCVNYATSSYAVGSHHIDIRVVAGAYNESVSLPDFDHGSGYIALMSDSGARDVVVNATVNEFGTRQWCFFCTGGKWLLYNMDARRVENPTTASGATGGCYAVTESGSLYLYGCAAQQRFPDSPSPIGGNSYSIRLFSADNGGVLRLYPADTAGAISAQAGASGDPYVVVFSVSRGGALWLVRKAASAAASHEIACSGSCGVFLRVWQAGAVNTFSAGQIIHFTGTMTGKRYDLSGGSHVSGDLGATFFPGDEAGTVEAATYCWYS